MLTEAPPRTSAQPAPATERIQARVLGAFSVRAGGRPVGHADWQRAAAERLVKLLLITPGHGLSRETAAEILWPGADPEAGRASLRKALHFAHRALGHGGALVARGGRIAIDADRLDLDLDRLRAAFDVLAASSLGRPGDSPGDADREAEIARAVAVVLDLGPRELLPDDTYDDWLAAPREYLRGRWQGVAIVAARRAQALGNADRARAIADQLLDRDPTDEAAHRLVIELLAAEGRHHAARRQFEMCRQALRDLVDAEPSPETVATLRSAERTDERAAGVVSTMPRLVGRRAELARVEPLFDRVAAGRLASLVVRGPTGIGKSRLLHEVAAYARAAGWRVMAWQSVESSRASAFGPLTVAHAGALVAEEADRWVEPARSAMATVSPGMGLTSAVPFQDRTALVDALLVAIDLGARAKPIMFAVDDLPWLDPATAELLERVVAGLAHDPILVAATCRDDEPIAEPAQRLLDEVRRSDGFELSLGPLAAPDMEPLIIGNLGGGAVQPELARRAFEQSEGNPLFCLELIRTAQARGRVRLVDDRWTSASPAGSPPLSETPDTVRRLVASRSAMLSRPTLELVGTAAELGSEVSFGVLQAVLPDLDGGLLAALDAAMASGLLVERGAGYAFAHPLYRMAVRGSAGSARRAGTHLDIACAIAGCREDDPPERLVAAAAACTDLSRAADHAFSAVELGAPAALPIAVALGFAAGARGARMFDPATASLLERALAAWHRLPQDVAVRFDACAANTCLANLRMHAGDEAGATRSFRDAIATARTSDALADAYADYVWLPYRHGDFEGALAILEEGLARLPADAAAARATLDRHVGWMLGRLHRLDEAIAHLEDAAAVLETTGDRRNAMHALDQLGIMLEMVHRSDEAIDCLERSLALALELHDLRGEAVRIHLGTALTRSGRAARARPHIGRGLEVARQVGDRYLEAVAAWAAAEMEEALGNDDAAVAMRHRELGLLASIGGNPHNEALAHAHLAHLARRCGDDATFDSEAAAARRLAAASPHPGYVSRIEEAIATSNWSELETG